MIPNVFIYALTDPRTNNEVRYIGKAINPQIRLRGHLYDAKNMKVHNHKVHWIRELLNIGLKPGIIILEEISESEWKDKEIDTIAQYKKLGARLTNNSLGGEGLDYWMMIERSKNKKYKHSVDTKRKIARSISNGAKEKWTPELRAKCKVSQKEASKTRKKAGAILWKQNGLKHAQFKELVQYDMEGNVVNVFYKAEELYPVFGRRIKAGLCCRVGGALEIDGFIFRYLNPTTNKHLPNTKESVLTTIKKITERDRTLYQYSLDKSILIKTWKNINEAKNFFTTNQIYKCVNGKKDQAHSFYWKIGPLNE